MRRIQQVLLETEKALQANGFSNPKRQAEDFLCELLNYSRDQIYLNMQQSFNDKNYQIYSHWIQRYLKGEPLAYLSGKTLFYGCTIKVDAHVLIPRQETEILVDKVVSNLKDQDLQGKILWDVCCGSVVSALL